MSVPIPLPDEAIAHVASGIASESMASNVHDPARHAQWTATRMLMAFGYSMTMVLFDNIGPILSTALDGYMSRSHTLTKTKRKKKRPRWIDFNHIIDIHYGKSKRSTYHKIFAF